MIKKLEINGVHANVDDDLRKYVRKKIGKLDRYLSRHVRDSVHVEVKMKKSKAKDKNQFTCETIVYLPHEVMKIQECTVNFYAATDIVEAKLRQQFKKYKELHANPRLHRRVAARLRGHVV
jgi:putative sigma-54 modulation protein